MATKSGYLGRLDVLDPTGTPTLVELSDSMNWQATDGVDTLPATVFGDRGWQDVERGVRKWDLTYSVKVTTDVDTILKTVLIPGNKITHHLYEEFDETTPWIQIFMIQSARRTVNPTALMAYEITATSCKPGSYTAPPGGAPMAPGTAPAQAPAPAQNHSAESQPAPTPESAPPAP